MNGLIYDARGVQVGMVMGIVAIREDGRVTEVVAASMWFLPDSGVGNVMLGDRDAYLSVHVGGQSWAGHARRVASFPPVVAGGMARCESVVIMLEKPSLPAGVPSFEDIVKALVEVGAIEP